MIFRFWEFLNTLHRLFSEFNNFKTNNYKFIIKIFKKNIYLFSLPPPVVLLGEKKQRAISEQEKKKKFKFTYAPLRNWGWLEVDGGVFRNSLTLFFLKSFCKRFRVLQPSFSMVFPMEKARVKGTEDFFLKTLAFSRPKPWNLAVRCSDASPDQSCNLSSSYSPNTRRPPPLPKTSYAISITRSQSSQNRFFPCPVRSKSAAL